MYADIVVDGTRVHVNGPMEVDWAYMYPRKMSTGVERLTGITQRRWALNVTERRIIQELTREWKEQAEDLVQELNAQHAKKELLSGPCFARTHLWIELRAQILFSYYYTYLIADISTTNRVRHDMAQLVAGFRCQILTGSSETCDNFTVGAPWTARDAPMRAMRL